MKVEGLKNRIHTALAKMSLDDVDNLTFFAGEAVGFAALVLSDFLPEDHDEKIRLNGD
jgi:hypothetical protein